jgi:hypothetical protein
MFSFKSMEKSLVVCFHENLWNVFVYIHDSLPAGCFAFAFLPLPFHDCWNHGRNNFNKSNLKVNLCLKGKPNCSL